MFTGVRGLTAGGSASGAGAATGAAAASPSVASMAASGRKEKRRCHEREQQRRLAWRSCAAQSHRRARAVQVKTVPDEMQMPRSRALPACFPAARPSPAHLLRRAAAHAAVRSVASSVPSSRAQMPATSTIVGASLGLGVQLYSNAVRKLPLLRSACPRAQPAGRKRRVCANPKRTCVRALQTPGSTSSPRASAAWLARTWLPGRCAVTECCRPSCLPLSRDPHMKCARSPCRSA